MSREIYDWLKACPNKFYKELRYENGICKVHVKENAAWFAKSLNLLLGLANTDEDIGNLLIYSEKWNSIDECDFGNTQPIASEYTFMGDCIDTDYVHELKLRDVNE